jgi:hypothetical protein
MDQNYLFYLKNTFCIKKLFYSHTKSRKFKKKKLINAPIDKISMTC